MTAYHDELFDALTHHLTTDSAPDPTYLWLLKYLITRPDEDDLVELWTALKNDHPETTGAC